MIYSMNEKPVIYFLFLLFDVFSTKKNNPSSSFTDMLISPMSRLSASSSFMSFNSIGNYKTPEQASVSYLFIRIFELGKSKNLT